MKLSRFSLQRGQALITLLFFAVIAMTIMSAAVAMIVVSAQSGSDLEEGTLAYEVAKSGAENGLLRLLRNPSYTGETLAIGNGTAVISVSSSGNTYTITSQGTVGNFKRQVQTVVTYNNNLLTVTSEKEIF